MNNIKTKSNLIMTAYKWDHEGNVHCTGTAMRRLPSHTQLLWMRKW